ncbi:MAG: ABC transporter substrate-binding protein [Lachnospiraceae bacterium]|nr:ABC transporter substrate-binding protein [Lachnospiraceae bacterium]MDY4126531.1 ABC transporter substrate-binding protein [Lachnospiraceae bacterium]
MKKKLLSMVIAMAMVLSLTACGSTEATEENTATEDAAATEASTEYVVGICNYVDDASLNQICDNIQNRLNEIGTEKGVKFTVNYDNCMADANVMEQIISDFIAEEVDLMVGVATPVAMAMQADTEDNQIPVIFAAVSDPLATGVVESLEAPGANVTGTSDFLDTTAVMNLIFAANPEADKIGLLYDLGQDASTTAIADAKAYLDAKGIEYVERTGTTVDEVSLAADALIADEVDAIFTPSDNTIMQAELTIYEKLADAGIPHYTGADSFALNGAFLGYGVDYANLGVETANMIAEVLLEGKEPATLPVKTFDNGTATVNTEVCEKLGFDYNTISETFAPYCTQVKEIQTAESFE